MNTEARYAHDADALAYAVDDIAALGVTRGNVAAPRFTSATPTRAAPLQKRQGAVIAADNRGSSSSLNDHAPHFDGRFIEAIYESAPICSSRSSGLRRAATFRIDALFHYTCWPPAKEPAISSYAEAAADCRGAFRAPAARAGAGFLAATYGTHR